jgi:hypothetical protein
MGLTVDFVQLLQLGKHYIQSKCFLVLKLELIRWGNMVESNKRFCILKVISHGTCERKRSLVERHVRISYSAASKWVLALITFMIDAKHMLQVNSKVYLLIMNQTWSSQTICQPYNLSESAVQC